eukprot:snap_masked-scaffold_2-processed-gene-21.30-mRNA-1 protein AED:1.00 eAED:1.00 QI:0/-1/0/0/-1/1/1/0/517
MTHWSPVKIFWANCREQEVQAAYEMSSRQSLTQYVQEDLQLRSLFLTKAPCLLFFGATVILLIIYSIFVFGRPEDDYWSEYTNSTTITRLNLGDFFPLNICEEPEIEKFSRLPANAFSSIFCLLAASFFLIVFTFDMKERGHYSHQLAEEFQPASILLRFPFWTLYIAINFLFLGVSQFLYYSSVLSVPLAVFGVAQWAAILSLVLCSVNRLLDPPSKEKAGVKRRYFSFFLSSALIIAHFVFFLLLLLEIDSQNTEDFTSLNSDAETEDSELYFALFLLILFLGVISAIVHWRAHSLSIDQQPILIFIAGLLSIVSSVLDSYDSQESELCTDNLSTSFFQIRAFGLMFLLVASVITYCFFRADKWKDVDEANQSGLVYFNKTTHNLQPPGPDPGAVESETRVSRNHAGASAGSSDAQEGDGQPGTIAPENLGPQPVPFANYGNNRVGQMVRRGNASFSEFLNAGSQQIRRATTEMASNRYVTPELGFTAAQIRFGEIIIGLVVSSFIIVVVYIAFA